MKESKEKKKKTREQDQEDAVEREAQRNEEIINRALKVTQEKKEIRVEDVIMRGLERTLQEENKPASVRQFEKVQETLNKASQEKTDTMIKDAVEHKNMIPQTLKPTEDDQTIPAVVTVGETSKDKDTGHYALSVVLRWCNNQTGEYSEIFQDTEYLWTSQTENIFRKLGEHKILMRIIGLSGQGKTELSKAIFRRMSTLDQFAVRLKFGSEAKQVSEELQREFDAKYFGELWKEVSQHLASIAMNSEVNVINTFDNELNPRVDVPETFEGHVYKRVTIVHDDVAESMLRQYYNATEEQRQELNYTVNKKLIPVLEKHLSQKAIALVKRRIEQESFAEADVILIDLPDETQTSYHWAEYIDLLMSWIAELGGRMNVVLFWQKEVHCNHFALRKFRSITLEPIKPKELVDFYIKMFNYPEPFASDALLKVAKLSRGVFRRFKKYVAICIDMMKQNGKKEITESDVRDAITLGEINNDLKLELEVLFPREDTLRLKATEVLTRLADGDMTQSDIVKEIFNGNKVRASRVLDKLENETEKFIMRSRSVSSQHGEKLVHLVGGESL